VAAPHHVVQHACGGYPCAARHGLTPFGLMWLMKSIGLRPQ
jgi:hypothetical protein